MHDLERIFTSLGAEFVTPISKIEEKLNSVTAFIFDWDGVFNVGLKGEGIHSPYSEADSMGTNLLRFAHWLKTGSLPFVAIITGQENKSAFHIAQREHFHSVYYNFKYKKEALDHIKEQYNIPPDKVSFFFDDVLDLSIASRCIMRFLIRRNSSPLFTKYTKEKGLCDYISGSTPGSDHAIREVTELIIGLSHDYNNILDERIAFSKNYQEYMALRNSQHTKFYTKQNGQTIERIF